MSLSQCELWIGRMVKDAPRVDNVELVVSERQRFCVCDPDISMQALFTEPLLGMLHCALREVDSYCVAARPNPMKKIRAHTDPDFQHSFPGGRIKRSETQNLRFKLITEAILRGAVAFAACLALPESANLCLCNRFHGNTLA